VKNTFDGTDLRLRRMGGCNTMQTKTTEPHEPEIYRETVVFTLGIAIIVVFVVLAFFFLGMFVYQITTDPTGGKPAPDWFYLAMGLFFVCMTFIIANFSKLTISANSQSITVRYGMFKKVTRWEDIDGFYMDEAQAFSYGGWGIRIGMVNGKRRLVYNVLGGQCVVLGLKKGRFAEFVFSTRNPDAVMDVVKGQIGK
jgi:hypothetical protein